MKNPKAVFLLDVQKAGDDLVVTLSSAGGERDSWRLGPNQQRRIAVACAASLSNSSPEELTRELIEMLAKEPQEVPFSA